MFLKQTALFSNTLCLSSDTQTGIASVCNTAVPDTAPKISPWLTIESTDIENPAERAGI